MTTLMGGCYDILNGVPTASDAHSGRRFYGIPDNLQIFFNYGGSSTDWICWDDNSLYETAHALDL